jgi:hypothetical protein
MGGQQQLALALHMIWWVVFFGIVGGCIAHMHEYIADVQQVREKIRERGSQ